MHFYRIYFHRQKLQLVLIILLFLLTFVFLVPEVAAHEVASRGLRASADRFPVVNIIDLCLDLVDLFVGIPKHGVQLGLY